MSLPIPIRLRPKFWTYVDDSGDCWLWTRGRNKCGYGVFGVGPAQHVLAHRAAWTYTYGNIPEGLNVLHRCDTRACVRPSHLFLGTQAENVHDMLAKRRHIVESNPLYASRGVDHYRAKLTPRAVKRIRALFAKKAFLQRELAAQYGVSQTAISKVVRGLNWRH